MENEILAMIEDSPGLSRAWLLENFSKKVRQTRKALRVLQEQGQVEEEDGKLYPLSVVPASSALMRVLGSSLRRERKNKNLTQVELGELINMSTSSISRMENGGGELNVAAFVEVCRVLEIEPGSILSRAVMLAGSA